MKWLMIAFLMFTGNTPLLTDMTVKGDKITVSIAVEANIANEQVTVAMTALDSTPVEWASATVYHIWYIDPVAYQFTDDWPNMKPGRFRVQVTLYRGKQTVVAPAIDVEVR
jgi:hypothetical protein